MKIYEGASRYDKASQLLSEWSAVSRKTRNKARTRFLFPYYAYRGGKYDEAIEGFDSLVTKKGSQRASALYYRGKAKLASGDRRGGREDHRRLSREFPDSWYSVVLRSRYRSRQADPKKMALARNGRWPGRSAAETPLISSLATASPSEVVHRLSQPRPVRADGSLSAPLLPPARDADGQPLPASFDGWSWPGLMSLGKGSDPEDIVPPALARLPQAGSRDEPAKSSSGLSPALSDKPVVVPPTWEVSSHWNPALAFDVWEGFVGRHEEIWPELPVAFELSQVGLYELAGPILAVIHKEVRALRRNRWMRARVTRWRAAGVHRAHDWGVPR